MSDIVQSQKKNIEKFIHFLIRINDNSIRVENTWKITQWNQIQSDNIFECFKLYTTMDEK